MSDIIQSPSDNTLFVRQVDDSFTAILIYVDDIMVASNDDSANQVLKDTLHQKFQDQRLGSSEVLLGS